MGEVTVGAEEVVDAGEPVTLTPVTLGNPHAVVRLDGATRDDLLRLGPLLEAHPRFPAAYERPARGATRAARPAGARLGARRR